MKIFNNCKALPFALLLACAGGTTAQAAPILGTAQQFAILAASNVTNTNATSITGDLGVAPGSAVTDAGSITIDGAYHVGDSVARQAQVDANAAYDALAHLAFTDDLSGRDLGGLVLTAGVFRLSSSAQLTGVLLLDAQDQANARFVFQIGSTLTTASAARIAVINGRADTAVFFDVGSAATLGAGTVFAGNLLARQSITVGSAVSVCGRVIAFDAAITLDGNRISNDCGPATDFGSGGFSGVAAVAAPAGEVPEPAGIALLALGLGALGLARRRPREALINS